MSATHFGAPGEVSTHMVPLGEVVGDPHRQKSLALLATSVWHCESGPEVVELQML